MLGILLTALKIIGIILLCILGFLLLAICIILFVPVRYKAKGYFKNKEDKKFKVTVSYLLHIVHISFSYTEKSDFSIRLFGIKLKAGKDKKKTKEEANISKNSDVKTDSAVNVETDKKDATVDLSQNADADLPQNKDNIGIKADAGSSNSESFDESDKIDDASKSEKNIEVKIKKTGIIDKIKGFFGKLEDVKNNLDYYIELIQRDSTKRAFEVCKNRIGKLLRSLLPRRGSINILFGLEDYGLTGKILGAYYGLLGYIGKVVHVQADFGNNVFETDFNLKGRIYTVNVLYQFLRIYFDKDCRKLIKLFKGKKK